MDQGLHNRPVRARFSDDATDLALLERIANGDRDALRQLYGTYYHPLLRFMHRLTDDLEAAQEGVNDVMLVVWDKAGGFGGRSRVSTWILGIAYRKALKLRSRLHKWTQRFKAADWDLVVEPRAAAPGLTDELMTGELLRRAIRQLPPGPVSRL